MKKVLLVDDSGVILRNMKALIEDSYEVVMAVSGKTAMAALERGKPDLILLDYEMPEMNGVETLKAIREIDDYKDIPIVFLTGADTPDVVEMLTDTGCEGYILKPTNKPTILETIGRIIDL